MNVKKSQMNLGFPQKNRLIKQFYSSGFSDYLRKKANGNKNFSCS